MDTDRIIFESLKCGKLHTVPETGEIYSTAIRGHEGERVTLKGSNLSGYKVHKISFNGVKKMCRAHQIMWIAAHGLYDKSKYVIDHINRNRQDNRLCNLRLVSQKENCANKDYIDTHILSVEKRHEIQEAYYMGNVSIRELARLYGVSKSTISNILHEDLTDSLTIPLNRWCQETIKAYGNAWVPQVAVEIFRAIEMEYNN